MYDCHALHRVEDADRKPVKDERGWCVYQTAEAFANLGGLKDVACFLLLAHETGQAVQLEVTTLPHSGVQTITLASNLKDTGVNARQAVPMTPPIAGGFAVTVKSSLPVTAEISIKGRFVD